MKEDRPMLTELKVIEVTSLRTWVEAQLRWIPGQLNDDIPTQFDFVANGEAMLKTPDGRLWWVPVCGLLDSLRGEDSPHVAAVMKHYEHHPAHEEEFYACIPPMLFEWGVIELTQLFCTWCRRFIDVEVKRPVEHHPGSIASG